MGSALEFAAIRHAQQFIDEQWNPLRRMDMPWSVVDAVWETIDEFADDVVMNYANADDDLDSADECVAWGARENVLGRAKAELRRTAGVRPDAYSIRKDVRSILILEIEDSHPLSEDKILRIAEFRTELDMHGWELVLIVCDRYGTNPRELCVPTLAGAIAQYERDRIARGGKREQRKEVPLQ